MVQGKSIIVIRVLPPPPPEHCAPYPTHVEREHHNLIGREPTGAWMQSSRSKKPDREHCWIHNTTLQLLLCTVSIGPGDGIVAGGA